MIIGQLLRRAGIAGTDQAAANAVSSTPEGMNRCPPGRVLDSRPAVLGYCFHDRRSTDIELGGDLGV
jgi:hypothetical protein